MLMNFFQTFDKQVFKRYVISSMLMRVVVIAIVFLTCLDVFSMGKNEQLIRNYIENYKETAINEKTRLGIPISIKLAQAIIESRFGTSDLATKANNHFGIKCKAHWKGEKVLADDDELGECFRKYPSPDHSFKDHSEFLKYNRLHFYDHLFEIDSRDYIAWAKGLQDAGYSTTSYYARSIIHLVERFELYKYDGSNLGWISPKATIPTMSNKAQKVFKLKLDKNPYRKDGTFIKDKNFGKNTAPTKKRSKPIEPIIGRMIHTVKEGESMESIARHHGVKVQLLYDLNLMYFGSQPETGQMIYLNSKAARPPTLKKIKYKKK